MAKTEAPAAPVAPDHFKDIPSALSRAAELHALMLGAQRKATETDADVVQRTAAIRASAEKSVSEQVARVNDANAAAAAAKQNLEEFQEKAFKRLGIQVNLSPTPAGGSTKL